MLDSGVHRGQVDTMTGGVGSHLTTSDDFAFTFDTKIAGTKDLKGLSGIDVGDKFLWSTANKERPAVHRFKFHQGVGATIKAVTATASAGDCGVRASSSAMEPSHRSRVTLFRFMSDSVAKRDSMSAGE